MDLQLESRTGTHKRIAHAYDPQVYAHEPGALRYRSCCYAAASGPVGICDPRLDILERDLMISGRTPPQRLRDIQC